jgi:histone-binding protein RBBP4
VDSQHAKGILASSSEDAKVNIWDCSKFGARQSVDERKYGPPELMFQHAGHRSQVSQIIIIVDASA